MEAAHLGAALVHEPPSALDEALARLSAQPRLPTRLKTLVSPTGEFNSALRDQYFHWWLPAIDIYLSLGTRMGISLGLPTWYYGHETFTPFASQIGKYFQNSVREDGLVTFCTGGVIYTPGSAGTLQEIFQDAAQNYYQIDQHGFSPMIFLGSRFWSETLGVIPLLKQLIPDVDYSSFVLITDSIEQAVDMLLRNAPHAG